MAAMSLEQFFETYRDTIRRLYSASNASAWNVSESAFADALWRSVERRFSVDRDSISRDNVIHFLDSIHIRDLALAVGCVLGDADAWRHLLATHRGPIDAFAHAMLGNSARANEIADSLWADLYGLRVSDGDRHSPLEHYGRTELLALLVASRGYTPGGGSMARDTADGTARRATRRQFEHALPGDRLTRSRSHQTDRGARVLASRSFERAIAGRPASAVVLLCTEPHARRDCGADPQARIEHLP